MKRACPRNAHLDKIHLMRVPSGHLKTDYHRMKRKLLLISIVLLLFTGCNNYYMICSLNPFYTEKEMIPVPQIEGSWMAKEAQPKKDPGSSSNSEIWGIADTISTWTINQFVSKSVVKNKKGADSTTFKPENYYIAKLTHSGDSINYEFKVVLFRVKRGLYADFIPNNKEKFMKSKLAANSLFEAHTLARVNLNNNQIELSWLGADCMKEMIEKKRVRVNYQWVKEANRFILTASPNELTDMIDRYADQSRFIDWENQKAQLELTRLN